MATSNRKELILEYMRQHNRFVTVEQLAGLLYVSGATIRRDLTELEASRLIRRTRGGAILVEGIGNEVPVDLRENSNVMQKQVIAAAARRHLRDGMTLFMDSSSTVLALARIMDGFSNLQVITCGVKTTMVLSDFSGVQVRCTGGRLRENSKSLVGQAAIGYAAQYTADLSVLSCRGFSLENGASEASEEEFEIKRQFMKNSKKAILLVDSSKMDIDYMCRLAPLSRFEDVITERRELNELIRKQGRMAED